MKKGKVQKNLLFFAFTVLLLVAVFSSSLISAATVKYDSQGDKLTINDDGSYVAVDSFGTTIATGDSLAKYSAASSYTLTSSPAVTSGKTAAQEAAAQRTLEEGGVLCSKLYDNTTSVTNQGFWWNQCTVWITGYDRANLGQNQITIMGQMIKWLILFLVFMMIYSGLTAVEFPSNTFLRIVMGIVVSFLATFLITTRELLTVMQGYTGLGIALAVFLPFLILGAVTFLTARTLSPIGIYLQKVLWIIFATYMVIKTVTLWWYLHAVHYVTAGLTPGQTADFFLYTKQLTAGEILMIQNVDPSVLFVLAVASIAAVIIMLSNKTINSWLAKEEVDATVQAKKHTMDLADARDRLEAESMKKGAKA